MTLLLLLALAVPNVAATPGLAHYVTRETVCSTRWGLDRRHVTETMKRTVAAFYGVPWADRARYEFDHKIPRSLGGADDVRNLWPQLWAEARLKDRLEVRLHKNVCNGTITLQQARDAFNTNWVDAYRTYIGPLPKN